MSTNRKAYRCPSCNKRTDLTLLPNSRIENAILWCDKCRREMVLNISPEPEP